MPSLRSGRPSAEARRGRSVLDRGFTCQAEIDAEYNVGSLREDRAELERLMVALSENAS